MSQKCPSEKRHINDDQGERGSEIFSIQDWTEPNSEVGQGSVKSRGSG